MRHKKQHFAFLTAKGKEENPTQDCSGCCKTGSPTDQGPAPQGHDHQGGNMQVEILENTEAPDLAQDTQHQLLCSMDSSILYPGWRKLSTSSSPSYPKQSRISSPISLETCQQFPKPMKVKTEENKRPATNALLEEKQSNLNTFLQGATTDQAGLATPQGSQQHHFPFHHVCGLQHLPALPSIASTDQAQVRIKVNTGSTKVKDLLVQYLSYSDSMNTCPFFWF